MINTASNGGAYEEVWVLNRRTGVVMHLSEEHATYLISQTESEYERSADPGILLPEAVAALAAPEPVISVASGQKAGAR